jgi:AhpC/TSA family
MATARCGVGNIKKENSTMFQPIRILAVAAFFALIAFGSTPKVGERVPPFSLPASDGRTVALKDFSGKKLVLVFYRGYW